MVDENKVEGTLDQGIGRVKDAVGGLTGDSGMQADGKIDQLQGHVKQEYGSFLDAAREQAEEAAELVRDRPIAAVGIGLAAGFLLGLLLVPSGD